MITTGNVFHTDPEDFDEVWVICYAVDELKEMFTAYKNVLHVPELAPQSGLFHAYRELVNRGQWDQRAFDEEYVPWFLEDIRQNEPALKLLKELADTSNEKKIQLVCFCDNENMCHRSIVAGILQNMGADIECSSTYSKYKL